MKTPENQIKIFDRPNKPIYLNIDDVSHIVAKGPYCTIFAKGKGYARAWTLKEVQGIYDNFIRPNRNILVNKIYVKAIVIDKTDAFIKVQSFFGAVQISRRRLENIKKYAYKKSLE
jgi:DNA-binding LytR/AlgR family response regulator